MANIRVSSKVESKDNRKPSGSSENDDENAQIIVDEPFTKRMRRETRDVHKISDALVNAKFLMCKFDAKMSCLCSQIKQMTCKSYDIQRQHIYNNK